MEIGRFIEENKKRNALLDEPYNPISGFGSPIDRQKVVFTDMPEALYLPNTMLNVDWVNSMIAQYRSIADAAKFLGSTTEELLLTFTEERFKHDFEFWAATTARIKPKAGGDYIPFILNRPQRKLHKTTWGFVERNEPIREILLKSRQFGGSTYIDIFCGYIQVQHKTNWNSLIAAHLNQAAKNIRFMFSTLANYYPKELDSHFSLKGFEGTSNIKVIPERNCKITVGSIETPDSIRADDVAIAHLTEVGLWKKTDGKSPEDLCQSILGTIPTVPWSLYALESTAKGVGNFFHRSWQNAVDGKNGLTPVFIPWQEDPKNRMSFKSDAERDALIRSMSEYELFLWNEGATLEGINFYRFKLAELNGNEWAMKSEFPTTCIAKGVRVGTDKGLIKIEECGSVNKNIFGNITNFYANGVRDVFELKTKHGYKLICTKDHRISINNEWKQLSEIEIGDTITLATPMFSEQEEFVDISRKNFIKELVPITCEFARFIGIFMGDGSINSKTLSIACDAKDTDFIDSTILLVKNLFGGNPNFRLIGKNKGCAEIRLNDSRLHEYFIELGIAKRRESSGVIRNICVPEFIFRSPQNVVAEFLKGLFETDGFCGYGLPKIGLFSKHIELLEDVQLLLLGFNITSKLDSRKAKNGNGYKYIANTLTLQGEQADIYKNKIGFLSYRKNNLWKSWEVKSNSRRTKNILEDKVVSVGYVGQEEVYDITVTDTHRFDANGILVHNCDEAFQSTGQKVFSPAYVSAIRKDCMEPEFKGDVFGDARRGKTALKNIRFDQTKEGNLWIWSMPDTSVNMQDRYCGFADIGGRTEKADFSGLKVFDRYWMTEGGSPEVVAVWHGHLDQDLFAWKCAQIMSMYGNGLLAIEVNSLKKQESEGDHFLTILDEIAPHYRNLYTRENIENIDGGYIPKYGFQTNVKSKGLIINSLNAAMRERMMKDQDADEGYHYIERDNRAVDEMSWYEVKPNGSMGAVDGQHDDHVIITAGGVWLATSYMPLPKLIENTGRVRKRIIRGESSF